MDRNPANNNFTVAYSLCFPNHKFSRKTNKLASDLAKYNNI
jgi:hypothetical protein